MRQRSRSTLGAFVLGACGVLCGCDGDDTNPVLPADASAPVDATTVNDGAGPPSKDGAAPSSGDGAVDATADAPLSLCTPALPSGWQPPPYTSAADAGANACPLLALPAPDPISIYEDPCFGDAATAATCEAALASDAGLSACGSCIATWADAGTYGPVVLEAVPTLNIAGCIQTSDPSDAGLACAFALQAADRCAQAACAGGCPITSLASQAAYEACYAAAIVGPCASFAAAASACSSAETEAGAPGASCLTSDYATLAAYFCR